MRITLRISAIAVIVMFPGTWLPAQGQAPPQAGQGAPPASGYTQPLSQLPAFQQPSTGGSVEFTRLGYALLTLRDLPQYFDDKYLIGFVTQQIAREQAAWQNLNDPRMPTITYEWQKLIDQQPELAGGPLLDVFLRNDPDWTFLNNDKRWDPNARIIVEVFLFSRDKIEGRQPDFAARELAPVVKRQLELAIKKAPTHFYFTEAVPNWRYDFDAKGVRIGGTPEMPNRINLMLAIFDPETKTGSREVLNQLPAKAQGMFNYQSRANEPVYTAVQFQTPPVVEPAAATMGMVAVQAWKEDFSWSKIPEPTVIAFDRQLQMNAIIPVDAARGEELTKLGGELSARVYFAADRIELQHPEKNDNLTVLFARLEKVEILTRTGGVVTTLCAQSFRAAKDAMASVSASPPSVPAKPATPAASQTSGETNAERVNRENRGEMAQQRLANKKLNCDQRARKSRSSDPNNPGYKEAYDACMREP